MFTRLAKSRLAGIRLLQPWRVAPAAHVAVFSNNKPSNDNLPGFRRPKGQRRIPTPALVCHWINRNGQLECRWQTEPNGGAPISDFDEHCAAGRTSGLSSPQPCGRGLALAG